VHRKPAIWITILPLLSLKEKVSIPTNKDNTLNSIHLRIISGGNNYWIYSSLLQDPTMRSIETSTPVTAYLTDVIALALHSGELR
jgi:hypothetical protein